MEHASRVIAVLAVLCAAGAALAHTTAPEIAASDPALTLTDLGDVISPPSLAGLVAGIRGRVPFQFSAPSFLAGSCAVRLCIRVAIADVCKTTSPRLRPSKVVLWIPDNGSRYATLGAANGVEGIGEPATLMLNRNRMLNPPDPSCGTGYEVIVTPSAAQIDRDLPIPNGWR